MDLTSNFEVAGGSTTNDYKFEKPADPKIELPSFPKEDFGKVVLPSIQIPSFSNEHFGKTDLRGKVTPGLPKRGK